MNLWSKRGKFSIIADMLEVADGGAGKTQIMYRANLSFRQLEKYLRLMLEIDLLDETSNNGRKIYGATHKGITFLQRYYAIKELLKTEDNNSYKNGSEGSYTITEKLLLGSAK
jgi:predicted transcriptional regulator